MAQPAPRITAMETDDRRERLWEIRAAASARWARAVGEKDWAGAEEHAKTAYEAGEAIMALDAETRRAG